jgi:hypothetical protein
MDCTNRATPPKNAENTDGSIVPDTVTFNSVLYAYAVKELDAPQSGRIVAGNDDNEAHVDTTSLTCLGQVKQSHAPFRAQGCWPHGNAVDGWQHLSDRMCTVIPSFKRGSRSCAIGIVEEVKAVETTFDKANRAGTLKRRDQRAARAAKELLERWKNSSYSKSSDIYFQS